MSKANGNSAKSKLEADLYKAFIISPERKLNEDGTSFDESSPEGTEYRFNAKRIANNFLKFWFFNNRFNADNTGLYGSFYFLHHKNSSVTDMIFSEIRSLFQYHFRDNLDSKTNVLFYDTKQIRYICENLISSMVFQEEAYSQSTYELKTKEIVSSIITAHSDMFMRAVVIDHYFTSTVAHIPPSLNLDIDRVVAESGYIHSAGTLLYIRRMDKAWSDDITERLDEYLKKFTNPETGEFDSKPINFVPYAKEFFDEYEPTISSASTRNGLDGVKLSLAKQHVGSFGMSDFLSWLGERYSDKLIFPVGKKDYKTERQEQDVNNDETLWILSDYGRDNGGSTRKFQRGDDRYLVIYSQRIRNHSQLITFKERKPAWYAPVTVPSTLSAALINISRTGRSESNPPKILDPFCGTGTFLIDAALRYKNAKVVGIDRNPFVHTVVSDNLAFFAGQDNFPVTYEKLLKSLGLSGLDIKDYSTDKLNLKSLMATEFFTNFFKVKSRNVTNIADVTKDIIANDFNDVFFKEYFASLNEDERLSFYILWRALGFNQYALSKSEDGLQLAIISELKKLKLEYLSYSELLKMRNLGVASNFKYGQGTYSKASFANPNYINDLYDKLTICTEPQEVSKFLSTGDSGIAILQCEDSIEAIGEIEDDFDIIITDPPYGVNTAEGGSERLFDLFDRMTKTLATKLAPNGELILTLPEFTRNGQQIPFYQTKNFIEPSLKTILAKDGTDYGAYSTRHHYWSSPSVLDRTMSYVRIK